MRDKRRGGITGGLDEGEEGGRRHAVGTPIVVGSGHACQVQARLDRATRARFPQPDLIQIKRRGRQSVSNAVRCT